MLRSGFVTCVLSLAFWGLVSTSCMSNPVKVLVRKHDTRVLAFDGGTFHVAIMYAARMEKRSKELRLPRRLDY